MNERTGVVTFQGNPLVLLGPDVKVGQVCPDFRVVDGGFKAVRFSSGAGKKRLISVVPSLDTPVCSVQTKRFNSELAKRGDGLVAMTISMDLPFAQGRFCAAEKVDGIAVLSDVVWREFGLGFGLLIKDMGLLTRAVYVVNGAGVVVYREIVPEITAEPDYGGALAALAKA